MDQDFIKDHRPWGTFEVLIDDLKYKVKRISVLPGKRLSYQFHKKRQEHWFVTLGNGLVTLEGKEIKLSPGQFIDIPKQAKHRIENTGQENLIFIEVQTGEYFGEDDIIRLEDDFGRKT